MSTIKVSTIDTPTSSNFAVKTNSATRLTILQSGNIGVGTVSPASPLHIRGTPDQLLLLEGVGSTSYMRFTSNSLNRGYFGHFDTAQKGMYIINQRAVSELDSSLYLGTADSVKLTITGDGNVGIGTTAPTVALDVAGEGKFSAGLSVVGAGKFSQSVTIGGATFAAPSGTAPIFGARAWGLANWSGTAISLGNAGNIASVSFLGSGAVNFTFTTAMPTAEYVVVCHSERASGGSSRTYIVSKTTSNFTVVAQASDGAGIFDTGGDRVRTINVAVFC